MNRRDLLKAFVVGAGVGMAGSLVGTLVGRHVLAPIFNHKGDLREDVNISETTYPNQIHINGKLIVDDRQESVLSLDRIFENSQSGDTSEQESEKNIADNLVVVAGSAGKGTGLLLTTDGFILTDYHVIQEYEDDWRRINEENPATEANIYSRMEDMKMRYAVVDQQRNTYPIDTAFWATNPFLDIALIKAVILRKPEPIDCRIITDDLKVGSEIKLLGLRGQRQYDQYGRVILASRDAQIIDSETGKLVSTTYDTFLTDAYGVPGFSGGVFTTLHGEVAGLALYIVDNAEIGHAGGAKARNIVELVKQSAYEINKLNKK